MISLASDITGSPGPPGVTIISTIPEMLGHVLEELGLHTPRPRQARTVSLADRSNFTVTEMDNTCLLVGWRLVREMGILKGLIGDRHRLAAVSLDSLSSTGSNFPIDHTPRASMRNLVRMQLEQTPWTVIPDYDRTQDWTRIAQRIGRYLPVMVGSQATQLAWEWLTHPMHLKHALPPFADMVWFEDQVIYSAQKELARNGTHRVLSNLKETLGIDEVEGMNIVAMAYACGEQFVCTDREQNRAMMVLRLEDYIQRCRESAIPDLRAEIYALKQISMIQGLSKADEDTSMQGIRDALARISDDRQRELEGDGILEAEAEEVE